MITWLTIIGMGVITYGIRLAPVLLLERLELSPAVRQALKFVPVAVLSAIILPELIMPTGGVDVSLANGRLLAGLLAIFVAWRTKNVLWTIVVGMVVLWLL
ncbi:MAG: AzlD domain-containing protein [Anaerolineae bacterium]|nr:AzlD domain-containing protein [Anaerolineae bacterium]